MKEMKQFHMAGTILFFFLILTGSVRAEDDPENIWPKTLTGDKGEIIMYQPQIESFVGDTLESRSAVAVKLAGQTEMIFGAMWFESHLATDLETRTATLVRTKVTAANFPDTKQEDVDKLSSYLEKEIPTWDFHISIDRLVASLPDSDGSESGFKSDSPVVYYREVPSVLVIIDGDPIYAQLEGFELEYVANSAFFITKDKNASLYLRGSGMWFVSGDLGGPWKQTTELPAEVEKVSQKITADEAAQAAEQKDDAANLGLVKSEDEAAPEIIISTVPSELITTDGKPDFASVEGTQLLYLNNTESDVLMDIASQQYFLLISGRWYQSKDLAAEKWTSVSFVDLPADFAKIPASSDMATVLASVPGTTESKEALLETQIPQTAEVDRKTATCSVQYDGDPEFKACGDGVSYALNTDKPVLLIDKQYYCVDSAVWFQSSAPAGPWAVATEVPAVVQDLPPDCPVYNVKYVYIYDSTPEVVYVGYTSGYYGSYVWGPCVVYGTGWYYDPWYRYYYYPRPITYGYGVHYSPYSGWGFSFGVSYGWLSIGVGWGRPPYYWGAGGYRYGYRRGYWHGYNRGYRHGYNRGAAAGYRAGYRAGQRQSHNNSYRNRKDGVKHTGDVRSRDGKRPQTSDRKNNVYADRNGDVYRNKDGGWEKREGGDWSGDRDKSNPDRGGDRDQQRDKQRDTDGDRPKDQAKPDQRDKQGGKEDRQQRDNNRQGNQQLDNNRGSGGSQLDRDRSSRDRGSQRQKQAPNRSGGQRRSGGGGGRRR